MSVRDRYLDKVERLRARSRKIPLGRRRLFVAAYVFVILVLIMSVEISPFGSLVEAGKPSPRTVIAPKTVQYIDKEGTDEARDAAAAAVANVYVGDPKATGKVQRQIEDFFRNVDEVNAGPQSLQEKAAMVSESTGTSLSRTDIEALLSLDTEARTNLMTSAEKIASIVMEEQITPEDLDEAREKARSIASNPPLSDPVLQRLLMQLSSDYIAANAVLDKVQTDRRKKAAREAVNPVITTRLQGEVVVSKGEVVTDEQVELLKTLGFTRSTFSPLNMLYTAVFTLILLGLVSMFLARYRRVYYDSPGLLALMGDMVLVYALIAKVLEVAARSWSPLWGYLMPAAAVTMIAAVLFDSGIAIVLSIVCAMVTGVVTGGNFSLSAFALLSGFFPALYITRFSTRHELRRAGLYTAFWVALAAFGATALTQLNQGLVVNTAIGFLNGAVCTVAALGSLPFLETTFRITTNTWLLELGSPEQPILKDLSVKAPGTYSHSVMVANLAEAAAREIGSDQMLARVTAYYHDVGKMLRPQFFVENQPEGSNMHKDISPNLSSIIITSHIRDGVEMLEKYHVPPDLIEIIEQHHGTSVVKYFYEKAVEQADGSPVDENRFRYHFSKPRRRTAGILMLADSVEAAARALDRPSASAIEQTVERIVDGKLEDGQLDECDLTFSDIARIKKVFARILIGSHHPRIDYPGQPPRSVGNEGSGHGAGAAAPR
jgi:cyclic-di-AMP phosphodiesterase PgpH